MSIKKEILDIASKEGSVMTKYITLDGLRRYTELMKQYIDLQINLSKHSKTNCPNCGAVITSTKCEYCGTDFGILFKES